MAEIKLPAGTTDIFEPIIMSSSTTYLGDFTCTLYSPDSDRNEIHNWKAKVQANFVFEECEDCHKIRNKKKIRMGY